VIVRIAGYWSLSRSGRARDIAGRLSLEGFLGFARGCVSVLWPSQPVRTTQLIRVTCSYRLFRAARRFFKASTSTPWERNQGPQRVPDFVSVGRSGSDRGCVPIAGTAAAAGVTGLSFFSLRISKAAFLAPVGSNILLIIGSVWVCGGSAEPFCLYFGHGGSPQLRHCWIG